MASSAKMMSLVLAAMCIIAVPIASATVYTVGDSGGWGLGPDYTTWASDKTFVVGDSLVFNYDSSHSVAEVPSGDYSACSTTNALTSESTGATTIPLKTTGTHYFVCGVSLHCGNGMKLALTVKPSGTATDTPAAGTGSGSGTGTGTDTGASSGTGTGTGTSNTPSSTVPESSPGNALTVTAVSGFLAALVWTGLSVAF